MLEFHGWATIQLAFDGREENNEELAAVVHQLQEHITIMNWTTGLLKLYPVNGLYLFATSGYMNHKSQDYDEILQLYQYIAQLAPGSYGLLYVHDDEDGTGYDNVFKVYVLMRGKLSLRLDPFLSPKIPTVEDP